MDKMCLFTHICNFNVFKAIMYTSFEYLADTFEFDKLAGGVDLVNPVFAAAASGVAYKSTRGPRQMALFGSMGALGMVGVGMGSKYFAHQFGNFSRFGM